MWEFIWNALQFVGGFAALVMLSSIAFDVMVIRIESEIRNQRDKEGMRCRSSRHLRCASETLANRSTDRRDLST